MTEGVVDQLEISRSTDERTPEHLLNRLITPPDKPVDDRQPAPNERDVLRLLPPRPQVDPPSNTLLGSVLGRNQKHQAQQRALQAWQASYENLKQALLQQHKTNEQAKQFKYEDNLALYEYLAAEYENSRHLIETQGIESFRGIPYGVHGALEDYLNIALSTFPFPSYFRPSYKVTRNQQKKQAVVRVSIPEPKTLKWITHRFKYTRNNWEIAETPQTQKDINQNLKDLIITAFLLPINELVMINQQDELTSIQVAVEVPVGKDLGVLLMQGVVDLKTLEPGWMANSSLASLAQALQAKISPNPLNLTAIKDDRGIRKL
jgi:hypothetical protein